MATKIKGIYKGFKFIAQIFAVVKEREMEIGYPTDVKHVAHIGWDGPSGSAPSWMNEYKTAADFSTNTALADPMDPGSLSLISPWSSQDFDQSMGHRPVNNVFNDTPPSDLPNIPKKSKRKKKTATTSPKSSSSKSSRTTKSKSMYHDLDPAPNPQS